MKYKLVVKPKAEQDAKDAALWYNNKREDLGNEFLLAIEAQINAIHRNPNQFQIIYNSIRRALIARFPYGIFFIVEKNTIYVLAILHTFRNPQNWKNRK
ncbi:MAG: addiction module toxin RelE [Bacteroidetes bacterium HGW-Bacteroidetes-4]|jgi:plasmid stabilization system protein ParE|nr:MAG: addiction module toxin RelE [Bacteroidetes bacterium HGW-Bacteroidetes-4]